MVDLRHGNGDLHQRRPHHQLLQEPGGSEPSQPGQQLPGFGFPASMKGNSVERYQIIHIVGARPNFMKIAPIIKAFRKIPQVRQTLVHTGQHYDDAMNQSFFRALSIPRPDVNLGVGSGSQAEQTGKIMMAFEKHLLSQRTKPHFILVVGDVNSTIACALAAKKLGVGVVHVEAGLRSRDWTMPEEINRVLTDRITDIYFITDPEAKKNLLREGVSPGAIHFAGNVMIDTLYQNLDRARHVNITPRFGVEPGKFILLTMHRPALVDNGQLLKAFLLSFQRIQEKCPIVFPAHPRTQKQIAAFKLDPLLAAMPRFTMTGPLDYHSMLSLTARAKAVITDSGGLQEETTALKIPCITIRENTERPVTCAVGSNMLVGLSPQKMEAAVERVFRGKWKKSRQPTFWDGKAAERIAAVMLQECRKRFG